MANKSRVVTVEQLVEAAKYYTELRRKMSKLEREILEAHARLITLIKRASSTTVKTYMLTEVGSMHSGKKNEDTGK